MSRKKDAFYIIGLLAIVGSIGAHAMPLIGVTSVIQPHSPVSPLLSESAVEGEAATLDRDGEGNPEAVCDRCPTIFYGGDADGRNGLSSERNGTITGGSWTFDDFMHPGGQITALWGNFLTNYTQLTAVQYEIWSGMTVGNCGTLVCSGTVTANIEQCPTGRTFFGFPERFVRIRVDCNLPPGCYHMGLSLVQTPAGRAFVATTSGGNAGPAVDPNPPPTGAPLRNGNSFFRSAHFGVPTCQDAQGQLGTGTWDFSYGVCGTPAQFKVACRWVQPWNKRKPTYESRVFSCCDPKPLNKIALDDFICCDDSIVQQIDWWGWLSTPAQGRRAFYVAFYRDNQQCQPAGNPVYRTCVVPRVVQYVGLDCRDRRIFRMSAALPVAFHAVGGQRYWVQISEADAQSVQVNVEDFRWSAHEPCEKPACWALEGLPYLQLPLDVCYQRQSELAFVLNGRSIWVKWPLPRTLHPVNGSYQLVRGGVVVETGPLMLDEEGNALVNPEADDGDYDLIVYVAGGEPMQIPLTLQAGEEVHVELPPLCIADSNLDGAINFADINEFVKCLSQ